MTSFNKMTPSELDEAIMYQIKDGCDLERLDHLLMACNHRENPETVKLQTQRLVNSCYKSKYV